MPVHIIRGSRKEQTGGYKSQIIAKACTPGSNNQLRERAMIDSLEKNMGYLELQKEEH